MTTQDPELSAALGWPGGIGDPVLDRAQLLQMVAALRLASQQALEALDALQGGCTDSDDGTVEAITVWCPEVLDALRAALAQEQAEPVQEQDIEDTIEAAYWHFDARKKGLNEWAPAPQSERDAFKAEARKLVKGYFLTRQAQDTKREMLAVADAFMRGKCTALAQEQAVTADMRSAVRWAPSSAYWSERLREFFGPDAREGIDALERRLAEAQEQAEPLQEPGAWVASKDGRVIYDDVSTDDGLLRVSGNFENDEQRFHYAKQIADKLNATPPRRTMVPLTEEDLGKLYADWYKTPAAGLANFARAVEKASWEKNNG